MSTDNDDVTEAPPAAPQLSPEDRLAMYEAELARFREEHQRAMKVLRLQSEAQSPLPTRPIKTVAQRERQAASERARMERVKAAEAAHIAQQREQARPEYVERQREIAAKRYQMVALEERKQELELQAVRLGAELRELMARPL